MQSKNLQAITFTPSNEDYVYLKILMVLENAIPCKKKTPAQGRGKGYGEYTTITAIAGEPTVVAD